MLRKFFAFCLFSALLIPCAFSPQNPQGIKAQHLAPYFDGEGRLAKFTAAWNAYLDAGKRTRTVPKHANALRTQFNPGMAVMQIAMGNAVKAALAEGRHELNFLIVSGIENELNALLDLLVAPEMLGPGAEGWRVNIICTNLSPVDRKHIKGVLIKRRLGPNFKVAVAELDNTDMLQTRQFCELVREHFPQGLDALFMTLIGANDTIKLDFRRRMFDLLNAGGWVAGDPPEIVAAFEQEQRRLETRFGKTYFLAGVPGERYKVLLPAGADGFLANCSIEKKQKLLSRSAPKFTVFYLGQAVLEFSLREKMQTDLDQHIYLYGDIFDIKVLERDLEPEQIRAFLLYGLRQSLSRKHAGVKDRYDFLRIKAAQQFGVEQHFERWFLARGWNAEDGWLSNPFTFDRAGAEIRRCDWTDFWDPCFFMPLAYAAPQNEAAGFQIQAAA